MISRRLNVKKRSMDFEESGFDDPRKDSALQVSKERSRSSSPRGRKREKEWTTLRRPFCIPSAMRGIDLSCQPRARHTSDSYQRPGPDARGVSDVEGMFAPGVASTSASGENRATRRVTSGEAPLILTSVRVSCVYVSVDVRACMRMCVLYDASYVCVYVHARSVCVRLYISHSPLSMYTTRNSMITRDYGV